MVNNDAREMLETLNVVNESLQEEKNQAYKERNLLVAFLSKIFPSHLSRHEANDISWDDEWRWIVCVHAPSAQMTWHIHDSEYPNFVHLAHSSVVDIDNEKNVFFANDWDGHTTEEKYERLKQLGDKMYADRKVDVRA